MILYVPTVCKRINNYVLRVSFLFGRLLVSEVWFLGGGFLFEYNVYFYPQFYYLQEFLVVLFLLSKRFLWLKKMLIVCFSSKAINIVWRHSELVSDFNNQQVWRFIYIEYISRKIALYLSARLCFVVRI